MKYDVKAFELLSNEEIADGIFDMRVKMTNLHRLQNAVSLPMYMFRQKLCADLFRCATAKTAYSALFIRLRARAQRLCPK